MTAVSPARSGVSPSSSPRLPSPPPIPEVQFGPKSPGIDLSKELSLDASSKPDEGAARRIRPGTKAADMALGPPLVPLNQLDSPFQLQEHLKSLYTHLTHTPESTHTIPITKETALQLATPPQINESESVDRNLWLYELCRSLTQKANIVSIFLMNDTPPCSSITCPEMRASEWQYLCAVHEPPKSCCAIDYCNHTLDWAANVLTSPKHFPSRLALGGEAGSAIQSMRQLTNIFRRVYRIFAHAWFQHRDVFWSVEATYGLYMFFKVVCDEYHLIPEDSYTIPPEAEGGLDSVAEQEIAARPRILHRDNAATSHDTSVDSASSDIDTAATTTVSTGATTRRHKHTPSTGSHVPTIAEGAEDEEEQPSSTISTKFNPPVGGPQLVAVGESLGEPMAKKQGTSPQLMTADTKDNTGKEPSLDRILPKLDIASTVPKYEPRAPEDPTPTGNGDDVDPFSVHRIPQQAQSGSTSADADSQNKTRNLSSHDGGTGTQPETPVNQVARSFNGDDAGGKVTSPSGGSIRTAGNDLLAAIMGHIDDEDEEDPFENRQTANLTNLPGKPTSDISGPKDDEDVEENEGMSPVLDKSPLEAMDSERSDQRQKESEEQATPQEGQADLQGEVKVAAQTIPNDGESAAAEGDDKTVTSLD